MAVKLPVADTVEKNPEGTVPQIVLGNLRCWIRSVWEAVLLDEDGFRLQEWIASGQAKVVRERGQRTIYRVVPVQHDCPPFFVKHDRYRGPADILKNFVRGSAARREWHNTEEALQRGVSTAIPIAWGQEIRGWFLQDTFFISREIPDVLPLDQFMTDLVEDSPNKDRKLQRVEVIEGLARFVAFLHEAGLEHGDFHCGNILVQPGPRFLLVDMTAVRFGKPLSWAASRANLTVLCAEWFDRSYFFQRWRFWRTYLRHRPSLVVPDREQVVNEFDLLCREYSRRIDRQRDRRAMRTNRDFYETKITHDGLWSAHAVRDLPHEELAKLLKHPDKLLSLYLDRPIKLGHSSVMVRAVLQLKDGPQAISFKRSRAKTTLKQFLNLFRSSRAMRGWRLGHALVSRRIATPRPIMICEPSRANRLQRTSYLATQWIDGADNLHLWCWKLAESRPDERTKSAIACARSLGSLVGRMHAKQISHGDLKGSNILIVDGNDNFAKQPLRTLLIDLDAVRIHKRLPRKRQVADLMRLATSASAHPWINNSLCRHFMAAYVAEFPRNTVCWKTLWKDVVRKSAKLIAKKRKRGDAVL